MLKPTEMPKLETLCELRHNATRYDGLLRLAEHAVSYIHLQSFKAPEWPSAFYDLCIGSISHHEAKVDSKACSSLRKSGAGLLSEHMK